jgi:hypothetical protein
MIMDCFQTITQFINTEDEEYNSKKYNKNACHFFALKTAKEFFKKKDLSKTGHEANIYFAINMNKLYQNHDMYFDEIIKFTNLKSSDICAATTELIESGDYPLDVIFPDTNKSYCLIILKNSKFFNVLHYDGKYFVRDCHEPFQYNFDSKNKMINHLNEIYQFNKSIVVDGYAIPEFSSIEYIFIDNNFEFKLDNVYDEKDFEESTKPKEEFKETEFGISIGKINYSELYEGNDRITNYKETNKTPINTKSNNIISYDKNKYTNKNYEDDEDEEYNSDDYDKKSDYGGECDHADKMEFIKKDEDEYIEQEPIKSEVPIKPLYDTPSEISFNVNTSFLEELDDSDYNNKDSNDEEKEIYNKVKDTLGDELFKNIKNKAKEFEKKDDISKDDIQKILNEFNNMVINKVGEEKFNNLKDTINQYENKILNELNCNFKVKNDKINEKILENFSKKFGNKMENLNINNDLDNFIKDLEDTEKIKNCLLDGGFIEKN